MHNEELYFIKISNSVLKDKNLNSNDKIIYSLIINLTKSKGYCWATNKSISDTTNISQRAVQNSINKLIKIKYI